MPARRDCKGPQIRAGMRFLWHLPPPGMRNSGNDEALSLGELPRVLRRRGLPPAETGGGAGERRCAHGERQSELSQARSAAFRFRSFAYDDVQKNGADSSETQRVESRHERLSRGCSGARPRGARQSVHHDSRGRLLPGALCDVRHAPGRRGVHGIHDARHPTERRQGLLLAQLVRKGASSVPK